jgi:tripartite-type tricarboxylate transporter receptor subunit TctC
MLVSGPVVLVAQPGLAATSLAQLIAYAKANPGKINYASGGSGNTTHLTAELFNSMAGINTVHVPYQGIAPAVTALLGGQSDIMFVDLGAVNAHIRSGKLRALAVGADKRHALLPGVPAMAEVLPGFMSMGWLGMAAPPATPAPIVGRLSGAIADVLKLPDVSRRVAEMNFDVVGSTPAEMQQFMRGERERWGQVIRAVGVKVE